MLVQMLVDDPFAKLHGSKYLLNAALINPLLPYELDLERPLQGVVG